MRKHPRRAQVDPQHPRGWATSDKNGMVGNLNKMRWQYDWRGSHIINLRILVHEDELDVPQRQLGTLVIPPDPLPLVNVRPENYSIDEQPVSTRYTIGPNGQAALIRVILKPVAGQRPEYTNLIVVTPGNIPP